MCMNVMTNHIFTSFSTFEIYELSYNLLTCRKETVRHQEMGWLSVHNIKRRDIGVQPALSQHIKLLGSQVNYMNRFNICFAALTLLGLR